MDRYQTLAVWGSQVLKLQLGGAIALVGHRYGFLEVAPSRVHWIPMIAEAGTSKTASQPRLYVHACRG